MSDERYIKVSRATRDLVDTQAEFLHDTSDADCLVEAYDAAEGQRVEEIRWCETHGSQCIAEDPDGPPGSYCYIGASTEDGEGAWDCHIVEATLILPPRAES